MAFPHHDATFYNQCGCGNTPFFRAQVKQRWQCPFRFSAGHPFERLRGCGVYYEQVFDVFQPDQVPMGKPACLIELIGDVPVPPS